MIALLGGILVYLWNIEHFRYLELKPTLNQLSIVFR